MALVRDNAGKAPRPLGLQNPVAYAEVAVVGSNRIDEAEVAPIITTGEGDPNGTLTKPQGSVFLRQDGGGASEVIYVNTDGASAWGTVGAGAIADPGDAAAVPVTASAVIPITTGAGGETGTVAIPPSLGLRLIFCFDVDGGGDRVITFASAINVAGNTIATFATARQVLIVEAIQLAGVLAWEVTVNNGSVALS